LSLFAGLIFTSTNFAVEPPSAERTAKYMEYRWQPERAKTGQGDSHYDRAQTLAKSGQKADALTSLEKAMAANQSDVDRALIDADFANLRNEPRFRNLFKTHARSKAKLTAANEPGDAMVVSGVVRGTDNKPIANAIMYVYHTDHRGIYSPGPSDDPPRLFGYLKTDAEGRYEFRTIRPGGYPDDSKAPQHIHYEVTVPGRSAVRSEFYFPDDPRLDPKFRETAKQRKLLATVSRDADGAQRATFDVFVAR
jgi:protocatechuate 3,4-dioxygenase beta subunit